eukprot:c22187_g1_i1 orf=626-1483(-)
MSRYMQFSPSGGSSFPLHLPGMRSSSAAPEQEKYLSGLLAEYQKLGPFMQVLPNCSRLLNQEIIRVTSLAGNTSFVDRETAERGSPHVSGGLLPNGGLDLNGWSAFQSERLIQQPSAVGWHGVSGIPGGSASQVVKKVLRIDVPVEKYPNFNFVGRLLGPRGNSLKRVESSTGCRVYIRGRGSVKDFAKESKLRDKPGSEHLNEPLHILIEAEQPVSVIDSQLKRAREIIEELLRPVDESHDYYKKQQLRELAMLNGTLREDSPFLGGSVSPFSNSGMKRPKIRQ